jgi:alpha-D-ribose 1-methylphosphonate 5-triphosphate synthase subunit PhnG
MPARPESCRQAWLRTLALAEPGLLARLADTVLTDYRFETLRAPETGLVLLRARIGGDGDRFNLGEATVSRCVLRHLAPDGRAVAGVGHVLGRDVERARRVAALDALLQRDDLHDTLAAALLQPLADDTARRQAAERSATEATRVRFFTLMPEATP